MARLLDLVDRLPLYPWALVVLVAGTSPAWIGITILVVLTRHAS